MSTRFYRFLLKYVIPQIQFFHATGPNYHVKETIRNTMRAGDVVLTKSSFHLTNLLIGGRFSHAAIVVGKDRIAELTANGFDVRSVDEFSKHCTKISLLRIHPDDQLYATQMAVNAMGFSDRDYDYRFTLNVDALYCSELVYQSDTEKRLQCDLTDLVGMGCPYISPEGLYQAKGLTPIYEWKDSF
jgi:uncharacterized protein YycO